MKCQECGKVGQGTNTACPYCNKAYSLGAVLTWIIEEQGEIVLKDTRTLKSYLLDLCRDSKYDPIVLEGLMAQGFSKKLYELFQSGNLEIGLDTYCETLAATYNINKINYIADSFYFALTGNNRIHKSAPPSSVSTTKTTRIDDNIYSSSITKISSLPVQNSSNRNVQSIKASVKKRYMIICGIIAMISFIAIILTVTINITERNLLKSLYESNVYDEYNDKDINETLSDVETTTQQYSSVPKIINAKTVVGVELGKSNVNSQRTFKADNAIDGNCETCWCVNTGNPGAETASIEFTLSEKSLIKQIAIINGNQFHPYDGIYKSNGQVCDFTLTFSDGSTQSFHADFNAGNPNEYQYFDLETPVVTDSIVLTVTSSYIGTKYSTNVSITEFDVY